MYRVERPGTVYSGSLGWVVAVVSLCTGVGLLIYGIHSLWTERKNRK